MIKSLIAQIASTFAILCIVGFTKPQAMMSSQALIQSEETAPQKTPTLCFHASDKESVLQCTTWATFNRLYDQLTTLYDNARGSVRIRSIFGDLSPETISKIGILGHCVLLNEIPSNHTVLHIRIIKTVVRDEFVLTERILQMLRADSAQFEQLASVYDLIEQPDDSCLGDYGLIQCGDFTAFKLDGNVMYNQQDCRDGKDLVVPAFLLDWLSSQIGPNPRIAAIFSKYKGPSLPGRAFKAASRTEQGLVSRLTESMLRMVLPEHVFQIFWDESGDDLYVQEFMKLINTEGTKFICNRVQPEGDDIILNPRDALQAILAAVTVDTRLVNISRPSNSQ